MASKLEDEMAEVAEKLPSKTFRLDGSTESASDRVAELNVEVQEPAKEAASKEPAEKVEDDSPLAGIEDMKRQLAEASTARERAELQAREALAQVQRAANQQRQAEENARRAAFEAEQSKTAVHDAQYDSIVNALNAVEGQKNALQAQYAALIAEGKWEDAARVNSDIAKASARIVVLEDGKVAAEAAQKNRPRQSEPQQTAQQTPVSDSQEDFLARQHYANAAWIRQHQDRFFGDPDFQAKAVSASAYALNVLKASIGSPEYYRTIDEATGIIKPEPKSEPKPEPKQTSSASSTTHRQSPTPAAPPTSGTPSHANGRSPTMVTLSPAERAHARATLTKDIIGDKDPEEVFARHKAQMIADGKWSNEKL